MLEWGDGGGIEEGGKESGCVGPGAREGGDAGGFGWGKERGGEVHCSGAGERLFGVIGILCL